MAGMRRSEVSALLWSKTDPAGESRDVRFVKGAPWPNAFRQPRRLQSDSTFAADAMPMRRHLPHVAQSRSSVKGVG